MLCNTLFASAHCRDPDKHSREADQFDSHVAGFPAEENIRPHPLVNTVLS